MEGTLSRFQKILIVLAILLLGLSFVPVFAFPRERITWQRYADAYQDDFMIFLPIVIRGNSNPD